MPKYIKSHSNYTLKSFHQLTNDGTIYERDITTIGGVGTFPEGQTPIYRSNNFIITVRDDGGISNQYNRKKWTQNTKSGDTWTMASLDGMVSEGNDQNDTKIVLKQDYYDFRDFCYYGSLAEMFRTSITDIIARFPGELYGTDKNVYYTSGETIDGEWVEDRVQLGDNSDDYYLVNPFGINMHAMELPKDADPLKYFANEGFKNYVIVSGDTEYDINEWNIDQYYSVYDQETRKYIPYTASTFSKMSSGNTIVSGTPTNVYHPCKGEKVGAMDVNHNSEFSGDANINLDIFAWLGDDNIVYYLSNNCQGIHIRPKHEYIDKFYDECDNFQKLILNRNTTPKYKATFSVIEENDEGFTRKFEDFIFPTSEGGYNIDASSYGFNTYTTRLSQIGEFYDELFTDNLYRSMTHEAIKNFDWTYTREYVEGDEEEYVLGGQKIQKALRVFAREFDEILSYINNIKNLNRVTYDERGNLPDYFLTDTVENEGWNVELVTPYYTTSVIHDVDTCDDVEIKFTQPSGTVTPYDIPNEKAYFLTCCSGGTQPCGYSGSPYYFYEAGTNEYTRFDNCSGALRKRIKRYTDDKMEYTYHDVNNEFLRRLKLNSRAIWRHKGTLDGIDMILSMFGMRSKKFCNDMNEYYNCKSYSYDYDITEYSTSIANPICDNWDAVHQMYHIDWINSTKTITYDYRSLSNYNRGSVGTTYIPYQGLPVSYVRNGEFKIGSTKYVIDHRTNYITQNGTNKYKISGDTFKTSSNSYIIKDEYVQRQDKTTYPITWNERYLYPNFNSYEQHDGNPYFQMKGGWLDKEYVSGSTAYHFQFNADDCIVFDKNKKLYKETVRNIRRFDSLQEMLSVPSYEIHDNQIVYVSKIQDNLCILDGVVYEIKRDNYGKYIELVKQNDVIKAGDDLYFTEFVTVYNRDKSAQSYYLNTMPNGQVVKAYISGETSFMCGDDVKSYDEFTKITTTSADTNYFKIGDFSQTNRIKDDTHANGGWERLKIDSNEYKMLSTIINDNKGNNPHNGMMQYDNGKEYFEYFKQLFKYPLENDLFDERCYDNYEYSKDHDIKTKGWSAATFSYTKNVNSGGTTYKTYKVNDETRKWGNKNDNKGITVNYNNSKIWSYVNGNKDTITNDKLNTKVIKITFRLHYGINDSRGLSELKYIDDIVLNYLTQMIPSTAILQIRFETR